MTSVCPLLLLVPRHRRATLFEAPLPRAQRHTMDRVDALLLQFAHRRRVILFHLCHWSFPVTDQYRQTIPLERHRSKLAQRSTMNRLGCERTMRYHLSRKVSIHCHLQSDQVLDNRVPDMVRF